MKAKETWQEFAARTAIGHFLHLLDQQSDGLRKQIDEVYPELGRQVYRYKDSLNPPAWPVEEKLIQIANMDAGIARTGNLRDLIITELRKMAEVE